MKRSEVIEQLADLLTEQRKDLDNGSDYQDAKAILDFLEQELGMKPPENGSDYDSYGSGMDYVCFRTPTYEWDKE